MKHLIIFATILISIFTAQAQTAEDIQQIQIEAQSGDNDALMRLGMLYQLGRGVEQNMEKGFEYIKQAAEQGIPDAFSLLSMCYFNGWGTKKDTSKAVQVLNTLKEGMPPSIQQEIDNTIATINEGDTLNAYEFQFRLLPIRLKEYELGTIDAEELIDMTMIRFELGSLYISHYECDIDSVSIRTHHVNDTLDVHVIHMPDPSRPPLCKFAAFAIDTKNNKGQYFTLEKTFQMFSSQPWEYIMGGIGISDDEKNDDATLTTDSDSESDPFVHFNYGWFTESPTEQNFVKSVAKIMSPNGL